MVFFDFSLKVMFVKIIGYVDNFVVKLYWEMVDLVIYGCVFGMFYLIVNGCN